MLKDFMIIWSGFGFLVVISIIVGAILAGLSAPVLQGIVGASAANYFGAAVFIMGAATNYAIGYLLYRSGDQVLIDPQTRQPYRISPNHSLFFIPLRAFTYIFLVIGIIMTIVGILSEEVPEYTDAQKERFEDVLTKVSNDTDINGGNTALAKTAAHKFQKTLYIADQGNFETKEVRLKENKSRGQYSTYCLAQENCILFAADVAEYGDYRDSKVKSMLQRMAWGAAYEAVDSLENLRADQIIVVLREGSTTRNVLRGGMDLEFKNDSSLAAGDRLYHLFDESAIVFSGPAESWEDDSASEGDDVEVIVEQPENTHDSPEVAGKPVVEKMEALGMATAPAVTEPTPASEQTPLNPLLEPREWNDNQGRQMTAKFLSVDADKVVFEKSDGDTYRFPLEKLSAEDQKLIDAHGKP